MEINLTFEDEGFDGSVTMKVGTNADRLDTLEKLGFDPVKMAGKGGEDLAKGLNTFSSMATLIRSSEPFYKKVDLAKDGKKYASFDELSHSPECQVIQMTCATKALLGLGEDGKK